MLTSVQREILQSLINLYSSKNGASIKGEEIAGLMNRNPGTIRNQMQSLRSLGLVMGVPGPHGGYKPTIKGYHTLNIPVSDSEKHVPIFKNGIEINSISVSKIEFTTLPHPGECEAAIKVIGSIKELDIGDSIRVGPTHVNKLLITGSIVGRDDVDNLILMDINTIKTVPKKTVLDLTDPNIDNLNHDVSVKKATSFLAENNVEGVPILKGNDIVGVVTSKEIVKALFDNIYDSTVEEIMSENLITVMETVLVSDAIDIMSINKINHLIVLKDDGLPAGIVTKADLLDEVVNVTQ